MINETKACGLFCSASGVPSFGGPRLRHGVNDPVPAYGVSGRIRSATPGSAS